MAAEDNIADVYEDYLEKQDDVYLLSQLLQSYKFENQLEGYSGLEDYEKTQIINMIKNIDYTGKYDCGFEDLRNTL